MMTPLNGDDMSESEIRGDLQKILEALREDRRQLYQKLEDVARKQDNVPVLLSDLERRQSTAMDTFRRDIERLFVPRVEFDPKYQIIIDKLKEYDSMISEGHRARDEYSKYKVVLENMVTDVKELQEHNQGTWGRTVGVISFIIAVCSFLFNFVQHISFK